MLVDPETFITDINDLFSVSTQCLFLIDAKDLILTSGLHVPVLDLQTRGNSNI